MEIRADIEAAIHAHDAWKARFRDFLGGKEGMDLSEIAHTDSCELGKWLESSGRHLLKQEDHEEICKHHAHFHQVAGEVIACIKQKDFKAAHQMVMPEGSFDQASHDLVTLLRKAAQHGSRQNRAGEI